MKQIGGINKLTIDGTEYALKEGAKVSLVTHTKVVHSTDGGVVGFTKEDHRAKFIEGTLLLGPNTSPDWLTNKTSVSCEAVVGDVTYIGTDGVDSGEGEFDLDSGEFEFKLEFTDLVRV